MSHGIEGIFPVMITPFAADDTIDWEGYAALIEWYVDHGASGLFAVCQSSEMFRLTLEEKCALAEFTVRQAAGRIPVVASGHTSDAIADQKRELAAIAATGVDAMVFVTNRFAAEGEDSETFMARMQDVLSALPGGMKVGLYECPAPYRRLLTDDELSWCAHSGRFAFLKDVSCDLATVKRRLALVEGTPLRINNANAAIAWPVMQAGGHGFSGIMNNFHPDLYRWLMDHGRRRPDIAEELANFLVLAAMCEPMGYPRLAKEFHRRIGTFACTHSRVVTAEAMERFWARDVLLDNITAGANRWRARLAELEAAA